MADDKKPDEDKPENKKPENKKPEKPEVKPAEAKSQARVCSEHDRASGGLRRFRVRATNADRAVGLYILAENRDASARCYLTAEESHIRAAGFDPVNGRGPNDVKLHIHVDELPD